MNSCGQIAFRGPASYGRGREARVRSRSRSWARHLLPASLSGLQPRPRAHPGPVTLAALLIVLSLAYAFINGLNDSPSIVAPVVSTHALRPRHALLVAAAAQACGPLLLGTAVARTVATRVVDADEPDPGVHPGGIDGRTAVGHPDVDHGDPIFLVPRSHRRVGRGGVGDRRAGCDRPARAGPRVGRSAGRAAFGPGDSDSWRSG